MSGIALVRTTFADRAEAERIAEAVVEARLAACANLETTESLFAWQGKIVTEREASRRVQGSVAGCCWPNVFACRSMMA